jgi:hypothetical protein
MQRIPCPERDDWRATAEGVGFTFHTINGERYWDESAYYAFTLNEIERRIEAPTGEIDAMCVELVGRAIDEKYLRRLKIPEAFWPLLSESWRRRDASLYGRLDLSYDGWSPAKLLEYNADTPTSIFEAAVFQWTWLEQAMERNIIPKRADQFNSIHERLIDAWKKHGGAKHLHLAGMNDNTEDAGTLAYLQDTASQAGLKTTLMDIKDVGWRRWPLRRSRRSRMSSPSSSIPGMDVSGRVRRKIASARHAGSSRPESDPSTRVSPPLLWEMFPKHPICCRPISRTIRRRHARLLVRAQAALFARRRQCRARQRRHHADGTARPVRRGGIHPAGLCATAELLGSVPRARKLAGRSHAVRPVDPRGRKSDHRQYVAVRAARHIVARNAGGGFSAPRQRPAGFAAPVVDAPTRITGATFGR